MATALPQEPSKAEEELEMLSETSLAFIKEALELEENGQSTSVRSFFPECSFLNVSFFKGSFTLRGRLKATRQSISPKR